MTTNTALLIPNFEKQYLCWLDNAFSEVPDRANACESRILLCKVLTRQDGAITSC
jgi:hypothetical protein